MTAGILCIVSMNLLMSNEKTIKSIREEVIITKVHKTSCLKTQMSKSGHPRGNVLHETVKDYVRFC